MERGQYLQGLLNKVTENGKMGLRAAGNTWELVDRESNVLATVRLKNVFVTGADALLHLEAEKENWSEGALVSMRLEGKEWRFTGVAPLKSTDLGIESELHRYFSSDRNEDAAMSALGAIYRQVMSAFGNHPDGYPSSLAIALQSQRIKQAAARATQPEEVSWMEHDPMVHQGYIFRYVVIDPGFRGAQGLPVRSGQWYATATPVEYSETGTRSFFIDETAVVRSTTEHREANSSDPPQRR